MFQKVAFTMFSVKDPMRARAFYEEVLGFTRGPMRLRSAFQTACATNQA